MESECLPAATRFGRGSLMASSSVVYVSHGRDQQPMVKIENPFSIAVGDRKKASLSDGLELLVSSKCHFKMKCYWGLECAALDNCSQFSWIELYEGVTEGTLWTRSCLEQQHIVSSEPGKNLSFRVCASIPIEAAVLGRVPRTRCPLVVVLMRDCVSSSAEDDEVVALLSAVHITDEMCTMDTGIMLQYMKQASGRTCSLQPLYVPMEESTTIDRDPSSESDNPVPLCVVCQASSATHALLPCRHNCVCAACFSKLDSCPVCRHRIASFFVVGEERIAATSSDLSDDTSVNVQRWGSMTWGQRLTNLNDRLNAWVGMY